MRLRQSARSFKSIPLTNQGIHGRGHREGQEIESQLYESDWFLLILSGVDEDDWSWCHHEAGLFCGMVYPDVNRVNVLYPPNVNLPDPLKKYQGVKCETTPDGKSEDVDRLFQDLFGEEPYPGFKPINSFFAHKADRLRQEAAAKIIQAVGRLVVESIVPEAMMVVHVPNVDLLDSTGFPDGTRIRRGSSTLAVLRSPADGRHYMPSISRVDFTGDNSATFTITFVQVAARNPSRSPRQERRADLHGAESLASLSLGDHRSLCRFKEAPGLPR